MLRALTRVDDDDCAVLDFPYGRLVVSTDYLNANPIMLTYGIGTLEDLGRLSVLVNAADVLSTGGTPLAFVSAIQFAHEDDQKVADSLVDGIVQGCKELRIDYVGGDTKFSTRRSINGTCIGHLGLGARTLLRRDALPDHDVWLSGPIGGCAAATLLVTIGPESDRRLFRDAVARPTISDRLIHILTSSQVGISATDISDGFAADLHTICRASGVGAEIWEDAVPHHPLVQAASKSANLDRHGIAMSSGGDLCFILVASPDDQGELRQAGFTRIGRTTQAPRVVSRFGQTTRPIPNEGHRDARRLPFHEEIAQLARIHARPTG